MPVGTDMALGVTVIAAIASVAAITSVDRNMHLDDAETLPPPRSLALAIHVAHARLSEVVAYVVDRDDLERIPFAVEASPYAPTLPSPGLTVHRAAVCPPALRAGDE